MILEKPNLSLRCVSRALISDLSPFSFLPLCRHGHVHTPYISPSMRFMPHYQDVWFLNSVEKGRYTHLVCFEKRKKKLKWGLIKKYWRNHNYLKYINICTVFEDAKLRSIYTNSTPITLEPEMAKRAWMNHTSDTTVWRETAESHAKKTQSKHICCSPAFYQDSTSVPACILKAHFTILTSQFMETAKHENYPPSWVRNLLAEIQIRIDKKKNLTLFGKTRNWL